MFGTKIIDNWWSAIHKCAYDQFDSSEIDFQTYYIYDLFRLNKKIAWHRSRYIYWTLVYFLPWQWSMAVSRVILATSVRGGCCVARGSVSVLTAGGWRWRTTGGSVCGGENGYWARRVTPTPTYASIHQVRNVPFLYRKILVGEMGYDYVTFHVVYFISHISYIYTVLGMDIQTRSCLTNISIMNCCIVLFDPIYTCVLSFIVRKTNAF